MAHKVTTAIEEFSKSLDDLISELDTIEKSGVEIFSKIENSFSYSYPISSVTNELNILLGAIQHFEARANYVGVTGLSAVLPDKTDAASTSAVKTKLHTMIEEKKNAAEELLKESKRIADNSRAAHSE